MPPGTSTARRWCTDPLRPSVTSAARPGLSAYAIFVVSTKVPSTSLGVNSRPRGETFRSTIGRLSPREGLSTPRFALRSRRREIEVHDFSVASRSLSSSILGGGALEGAEGVGVFSWTIRQPADGIVVAPDQRLPWPQTIALGIQHVLAMFGATVLGPLLMGFDPNVAVLMSGVGTLIFFVAVGGKVPSYVGRPSPSSRGHRATGYTGQGLNATSTWSWAASVCGAVYALIGLAVTATGTGWFERLMPPVVTGSCWRRSAQPRLPSDQDHGADLLRRLPQAVTFAPSRWPPVPVRPRPRPPTGSKLIVASLIYAVPTNGTVSSGVAD